MFRGEFSLSMDPKGRLAVPSRYRERLVESGSDRLVITIGLLERCLTVYPFADWQRIEEELRRLPALDIKAQAVTRLLIGQANDCELDNHGRLLVPAPLREFAGLDKHVKMIGQVHKFELWSDATWALRREELLKNVGELLSHPSEALRSLVL